MYREKLKKLPLEKVQELARGGDFNAKCELFHRQNREKLKAEKKTKESVQCAN